MKKRKKKDEFKHSIDTSRWAIDEMRAGRMTAEEAKPYNQLINTELRAQALRLQKSHQKIQRDKNTLREEVIDQTWEKMKK